MYGYIKPPGLSIWLRESSHRNRATIFSASLHGWVSPLQRNARVRQSTSHPEVYTGVIKRKVRLVVGDLLSLNSHQVFMLLPSFWARVVSRVSSEHVEGGFWKYAIPKTYSRLKIRNLTPPKDLGPPNKTADNLP